MPISTGTSIKGRQFIGGFNTSQNGWLFIFNGSKNPPISERVGTLIVYQFISASVQPAQSVFKLYGNGVYWPNYPFDNVPNMRIDVIWFKAGWTWQFNRP